MAEAVGKLLSRLQKAANLAAERAKAARKNPEGLKGEMDAALASVERLCANLAGLAPEAVERGRGITDKLLAELDGERATELRRRLGALHPGFVQATARPGDGAPHGSGSNGTVFSGPGRVGPQPFAPRTRPQPRPDTSPERPSPFKPDAWVVQVSTGRMGHVLARMGTTVGPLGAEWELLVDVEGRGREVVRWTEHELRLATENEHQLLRAARQREENELAARWAAESEAEAVRAAIEKAEAEEAERREAEAARRAAARLAEMRKARGSCELLAVARKTVKDGEVLLGRASVDGEEPAHVVFKRMAKGNLKLVKVYRGKAAATRVWRKGLTPRHVELKPEAKKFDRLCAEVAAAVRKHQASASCH